MVNNVRRVSVLIIDSNVLFRQGLRELLSGTQFEVIHEASEMSEGLEIIRADQELGMALLDLRENDADRELQMLRQMRSVNNEAKLVVLANGGSAIQLARTLDAGADGYLPQSLSREALVLSLKSIELGEKVFPTSLATQITRGQVDPTLDEVQGSSVRRLSVREREILLCLHWGEPNKTIARRYGITEGTVKVHLKALFRKLNLSNRREAAVWAVQHGVAPDTLAAGSTTDRRFPFARGQE